eukprot:11225464-Lingulodinium_polyedra.AAC.1
MMVAAASVGPHGPSPRSTTRPARRRRQLRAAAQQLVELVARGEVRDGGRAGPCAALGPIG